MSVDQKISLLRKEADRLIDENEKLSTSYREKLGLIVKLVAESAVLERKVDALTRERDQAMDVVREVEWTQGSPDGTEFCPSCKRIRMSGHADDCKLRDAVKAMPLVCPTCKGEKLVKQDGMRVNVCPECCKR